MERLKDWCDRKAARCYWEWNWRSRVGVVWSRGYYLRCGLWKGYFRWNRANCRFSRYDLFELLIPLELALCLNVFVHKKYFTLTKLNKSITQFPYKFTDKTDHPQPIPANLASRKNIGGNASENRTLLRLLSFIIGAPIPLNDPAWHVLMILKDMSL